MIQKVAAMIFAMALLPAWVFAEAEMKGTVVRVDKGQNHLVVKTDKGEETLLVNSSSKGMDKAKEGARVTIKFTEKDGQPKVIAVTRQEGGTVQVAPR
ncbi:MAG TPA: hypothetical protein VGL70_23960 [Candidatus Binatia bacterium]|jgi:hypothetical protein